MKLKPNRRIENRPIKWGRIVLFVFVLGALAAGLLLRQGASAPPEDGAPDGGPPAGVGAEGEAHEAQETGDGSAADGSSGSDGSVAEEAPPPPAPGELPIVVSARTEDRTIALRQGDNEERLPTEVAFELRSERAFPDLRMRLFDERGRLVPSEESATVGDGTTYTLRPSAPLITGSAYKLVVDSQEGSQPRDVEGESYAPASFSFQTEGEKPPPPRRRRGRR